MLTLREIKRRQAAKAFLPLEVRKGLHELGYTEPHQSDWSVSSHCGKEFLYKFISKPKDHQDRFSIYMLLGNVFHEAISALSDDDYAAGTYPEFWWKLFRKCLADPRNEGAHYYLPDGTTARMEDIKQLCLRMVDPDVYGGTSMYQVIARCRAALRKGRWRVVAAEKKVQYIDGNQYPIRFAGTFDFLLEHPAMPGEYREIDAKTWGLWGPLLAKSGVKAQAVDLDELRFDTQHRHYLWLARRAGYNITSFGWLLPANFMPYLKATGGKAAGSDRGEGLVVIDGGLEDHEMELHEEDLLDWLRPISQGVFPRSYPKTYGKSDCPKCPYMKTCIGGERRSSSDSIPNYALETE